MRWRRRRPEAYASAAAVGSLTMRSTCSPASAPAVVVGGDGDDGAVHLLAEVVLRHLLHVAQDERRDLLQRHALAAELDRGQPAVSLDDRVGEGGAHLLDHPRLEGPPDEPLRAEDRVARAGQELGAREVPHHHLVALVHSHHRGDGVVALARRDDVGLAVLHHRGAGVARAEVDPDDDPRSPGGGHRLAGEAEVERERPRLDALHGERGTRHRGIMRVGARAGKRALWARLDHFGPRPL